MKKQYPEEMKSYVRVGGEDVPVDCVEFLNIEEDFQGRDLMTFNYKGEKRQSYVFSKH